MNQVFQIEKQILSCMMMEQQAAEKVILKLFPSDFSTLAHRIIFDVILELWKEKQSTELVFVNAKLEERNMLQQVGGTQHLMEIAREVATTANIDHLIRKVIERRQKKAFQSWIQEMNEMLTQGENLESLYEKAANLPLADRETKLLSFKKQYLKSLESMMHRREIKDIYLGVKTGFADLDILTKGLRKKTLTIIAGRPSMGKSVAGLDIARNAAADGKVVLFFSLEMGEEEIHDRIKSSETLIPLEKITCPALLTDDEIMQIYEQCLGDKLRTLMIVEKANATLRDIRIKCQEAKLIHGRVDLVVIDYLQYMGGHPKASTYDRVTENSKGLKALAKDFDIPVVALSQVSREVDKRQDKRPILADLRESGAIEQDADIIGFLYRQEYYLERDSDATAEQLREARGKAILDIQKHRNGRLGTVKLTFHKECATFRDAVRG